MGIVLSEYVDVQQRATELGLVLTSALAILPRGFGAPAATSSLAHEAEASTLRKLLKAQGIDVQQVEPPNGRLPSVVERSADWLAPTLFVGSMLFTENSYAVQVALNVVGSYAHDMLKGRRRVPEVKLTFVVEQSESKKYCCIEYEGPVSGINELADVLREVHDGRR
jgi:hypothetical protein